MKNYMKKFLSLFLSALMIFGVFPTLSVAQTTADLSNPIVDSADDDGVYLSKNVSYDPATGKVTTVVEAYTTGTVTTTAVAKPTDIILVLDVSGSMDNSFGDTTGMAAMKAAVNSFIDATAALNESVTDPLEQHSIAIVKFADNSFYGGSANITPGDHKNGEQNYTEVVSAFTAVDANGAASLKSDVAKLTAGGATAIDYGFELAMDLLDARAKEDNGAYDEREIVVIAFTDGDPTHSSGYEDQVAYNAVNEARLIKASGAKLYTIGIFSGANPSGTDDSNVFMNYVSSNYPLAYGLTRVEYSPMDIFQIFPQTVYEINPGDAPYGTGYYKTASNIDDLGSIFNAIAGEVGTASVSLGNSATLVDVISDYFTVENVGGVYSIKAETAEYLGNGSWDTPVSDDPSLNPSYDDIDTITLGGFDFDENFVSETPRDGFYGKKVILTIVTTPDYDAIDAAAFESANIPTNKTAALCDSEGNVVDSVPAPSLTANTVTYEIDDGTSRVVEEYYRFPGADVTIDPKPIDTANYIYGAWKTAEGADAADFEMPDEDVVLTSFGSPAQYYVTYTYLGNVPEGVSPKADTLPTNAEYNVGATVGVPYVEAPVGYKFTGWVEDGDTFFPANADGHSAGQTFEMPAENVVFTGRFVADYNTYTVEHYLMNTDGKYSDELKHAFVRDGVKTGDYVTADTSVSHTGFTFDSAAQNILEGKVSGDGKLTLKVYFKRNAYTVTYQYAGTRTPGSPDTPVDKNNYYYGATVALKDVPVLDGYTFYGWRVQSGDTAISADGKIVMPNSNVVLVGDFRANGDTKYTIEHHFENLDGTYSIDSTKTEELSGATGNYVNAIPLSGEDIIGFVYDATKTNKLGSGTIEGDGSLVLKLYYTRATYTVTYQYAGTVPTGATELSTINLTGVKYGASVKVAPKAEVYGYTFDGWNLSQGGVTVDEESGSFTMPARDVVFTGRFNKIATSYKVEHYLMGADGKYTDPFATDTFNIDVYAGNSVKAELRTFNTYEYDLTTTAKNNNMSADAVSVPTGTVDAQGNLVLKVYYARKAYGVTYKFEGTVPEGITVPTDSDKYIHGSSVTLATVTAPVGYTFDGWYNGETKITEATMEMPRNDVTLVGRFTANSGIGYTVEYYFQDLVGDEYTKDASLTQNLTGTTGEYVQPAQKSFTGFTFNATKSNWNGHIAGDGSLVLALYYDRNVYNVTYSYFGALPTNTDVLWMGKNVTTSLITKSTARYGDTVTVLEGLTASGENYQFRGWYTSSLLQFAAGDEIQEGATFTMPARNVEIYGAVYDYVVYYNLDGGNIGTAETVDPKHVDFDDAGLLPDGTPTKDGAVFTGWAVSGREEYVTNESTYASLVRGPAVVSVVLTAQYADTYGVTYEWGDEVPDGVTLPVDANEYKKGDTYTVDTAYTNGYVVNTQDSFGNVNGKWTFSGWTDPNSGVMGGADVTVTGSWEYEDTDVASWNVTYEWTGAPTGKFAQTLPAGATGVVNGDRHTVDTTFTAGTTVIKYESGIEVGKWTFSGWDKTGELTVTENVTISGKWTYEETFIPPIIISYGRVTVTKVDSQDTNTTLAGVEFRLYRGTVANSMFVGKYTTDKDGQFNITQPAGTYYLVETKPHEGYTVDSTPIKIVIRAGVNGTLVVTNEKTQVPVVFTGDHYAYIIGRDDGLVHPEEGITRAEVATIFFRMLDDSVRESNLTKTNSFSDVNEGDWYNTAISTLAAMGILRGEDGKYRPDDFITRAEFSAIAARFDTNGNSTDASFTDIYEHWGQKEINTAANNGWILGYEDGTFKPDQLITRAEAMTIVNRVLQRIPESTLDLLPDMIEWPDNSDTSEWYYLAVQEATNSHDYVRKDNGYESWIALLPVRDWTVFEK